MYLEGRGTSLKGIIRVPLKGSIRVLGFRGLGFSKYKGSGKSLFNIDNSDGHLKATEAGSRLSSYPK